MAGLMGIDEFEDYLEFRDPKVREHIRKSYKEYLAGKGRPAEKLLAELKAGRRMKVVGRRTVRRGHREKHTVGLPLRSLR